MGLSESTVSLALNDKKTVGEKTKKKSKKQLLEKWGICLTLLLRI